MRRFYNDLGLAFTQCGDYGKAAMYLEEFLTVYICFYFPGRIYNDLGLAFTQCGEYSKAAMCSEEFLTAYLFLFSQVGFIMI